MKNSEEAVSWSKFYSLRKKMRRAYPSVFDIKITKKMLDVVIGELRGKDKILDVGASDRTLGEKITTRSPSIIYKTMDIDREQSHDYYSLDEISESFDIIILSEVIEHLEFKEGISMLGKLFYLLNNNGKIIISTPNTHHPNRYWEDTDHKTPYQYDVIGGALLYTGFTIDKMFRTYNDQFLKRLFRIHVASYLHKFLDIDFAKSIIVVASKN